MYERPVVWIGFSTIQSLKLTKIVKIVGILALYATENTTGQWIDNCPKYTEDFIYEEGKGF